MVFFLFFFLPSSSVWVAAGFGQTPLGNMVPGSRSRLTCLKGRPSPSPAYFFFPLSLSLSEKKKRNETLVCTSFASLFFCPQSANTAAQINSFNVWERLILCRAVKSQLRRCIYSLAVTVDLRWTVNGEFMAKLTHRGGGGSLFKVEMKSTILC